ncbi:hypothetical protein Cni_G06638 [Canna indica]|uniref:HVA22-like protein n=1 Tax=Canna indica TaxID=4628 RepID=A0AAQ3Q655_9LILI|nr:hypothetical protein Cni_G06638 [Canna indica]
MGSFLLRLFQVLFNFLAMEKGRSLNTDIYNPFRALHASPGGHLKNHITSFPLSYITSDIIPQSFISTGKWVFSPAVMLLYPLYASTRAIESPSPVDDQQWLTCWVLYSLITLFELSFWRVLQWFPLWPYMKLLFCIWLVLPAFNGAAYIYANHVRGYVRNYVNWSYPEKQRKVMQLLSLDARKSVEQYIEKHGTEAFIGVIETAEKEARMSH